MTNDQTISYSQPLSETEHRKPTGKLSSPSHPKPSPQPPLALAARQNPDNDDPRDNVFHNGHHAGRHHCRSSFQVENKLSAMFSVGNKFWISGEIEWEVFTHCLCHSCTPLCKQIFVLRHLSIYHGWMLRLISKLTYLCNVKCAMCRPLVIASQMGSGTAAAPPHHGPNLQFRPRLTPPPRPGQHHHYHSA